MKASRRFVFSVTAILLAAGLVLAGCGEKEPSPPELSAPYLSATAIGPDTIRLTWTSVENADTYHIAYAASAANLTDNAGASYSTRYTQYDVPGLQATAKSSGSINVDWTHSPYATGYQIEYWTGAYGTRSVVACEIPPYLVTGLNRNTTYNFVVRAKNEEGFSPYSMQVSAATLPR